MKTLYDYLAESLVMESISIPSFTVGAMVDLLACKSVDAVTKFFTDQGYDEKDNDSKSILKSIQALNKDCEVSCINVDLTIFNNFDKHEIDVEYGLTDYPVWVIYMTEGDSEMLLIASKKTSAEKVLKEFVKGCDRDVMIATSWR